MCRIEKYSKSWTERFDTEWKELDAELRLIFTKSLNSSTKKDKDERNLIDETEVL